MRRYPAYRDSSVEWLGDVPTGWDVVPLKYLVSFQSGGTPSKDNLDYWGGDIPWASAKDLKVEELADTELHITTRAIESGAAGLVDSNAVIVLVRGMTLAKSFPVCVAKAPMAINQDLKALISSGRLAPDFLAWLLRGLERESLSRVDEAGHGTKALRMDAWRTMEVVVPPRAEQQQIVQFLAQETAKIDALVAEQQRLVQLLREKRQAVISRAVTRGLDLTAALKPSGVEWLGDVPERWKATRIGRHVRILSGFAFPSESFSHDETNCRLLRGVNVGVGAIAWTDAVYWRRSEEDGLDAFELRSGDLVIGMDRPWISAGLRLAVLSDEDVPCLLLQRVAAIRGDEALNRDYLALLLQSDSFRDYALPDTTGVSVPHISPGQIATFPIALPPRAEQDKIVSVVHDLHSRMEALLNEAEAAIVLLQERRAALISAAVTGKINLREVTADAHVTEAA